MRDFGEYLRAYRAYVLANLGWGKALSVALVSLAGMFAPLVAKTLFELPNWAAMTWMIVWALLGSSPHDGSSPIPCRSQYPSRSAQLGQAAIRGLSSGRRDDTESGLNGMLVAPLTSEP